MLIWLLICCSSLCITGLTQPSSSENLICPEPKIGGSQIAERNGLELPYYTAGFT